MKKTGIIAGISFVLGALFFALSFGYWHHNEGDASFLGPDTVYAQSGSEKPAFFSFAPIVKRVRPAVILVTSHSIRKSGSMFGDDFFDDEVFRRFFRRMPSQNQQVKQTGSGFIISSDGYIITNNHVVRDAIKIIITDINQKSYKAEIVGTDPKSDLALLKIKGDNFPYIQLGDSDAIEVGEFVIAIGNPLGQNLTVTSGIISAKGRRLTGLEVEDQNFIQTDAPINRGNSGGPLINLDGKAIGINSVILSSTGGNIGIGFSIPSNMAKKVMKDLKREGRVIRGYLGIRPYYISEEDAKSYEAPSAGIYIMKVEPDTPADKAGLKKWDFIVAANGKKYDLYGFQSFVANTRPGTKITLTIYRKKKKMDVEVTIVENQDDAVKVKVEGDDFKRYVDLGLELRNNSSSLARRYNLDTSRGIVVFEVKSGSNASENGLKPGDIILSVNRTDINSVSEFRKIIASKKPGATILLEINRRGEEGLLKYTLPFE